MLLRSTTASISRNASGFGCLAAAAPDSAPESAQDRFRLSPSELAILAYASVFVVSHRGLLSYSRVSRLALHSACAKPLRPLLTSGGSSQRLTTPVAQRQVARSPRVLRTHFHAYACRIYITAFRASTGLCENSHAHPTLKPLSASCSSGQRFAYSFLQIPPRDGHPCRSANTSPCRVCRGLTPPSECALPGAPR